MGERAQAPGGWAEAVAVHKGLGRELLAHSLSSSSGLISTLSPTQGGK